MQHDLIQRLKEGNSEERKALAIKLAPEGDEEIISELITIANGGHCAPEIWEKKHWYSARKKAADRKWQYALQDQLDAIEALGKTRNPIALHFVKSLLERVGGRHYTEGGGSASADYGEEFSKNAKGELSDALYSSSAGGYVPKEVMDTRYPDEKAMQTIQYAVKNLETAIEEEIKAKMPKPPVKKVGRFKHLGAPNEEYVCAEADIGLRWGIHARPASIISRYCEKYKTFREPLYDAEVIFEKVEKPGEAFEAGNPKASAGSIMGLMCLETHKGDRVRIYTRGTDTYTWEVIKHLAEEIQREDFNDMDLKNIPAGR
jgi:phosphotransferase system HPr (HPr) family protein